MWIWILILITVVSGIYVHLHYRMNDFKEGFKPRCPNLLIQNGQEIWLKNTNLADVPGVNPMIFHSLEEYTEFISWQKSRGINCPLLYLQKSYDAQNDPIYTIKPPPDYLLDATRNDPPYNTNSYPGMDPQNQGIGDYSMLDEYHEVGETSSPSKNAMDPNWV